MLLSADKKNIIVTAIIVLKAIKALKFCNIVRKKIVIGINIKNILTIMQI